LPWEEHTFQSGQDFRTIFCPYAYQGEDRSGFTDPFRHFRILHSLNHFFKAIQVSGLVSSLLLSPPAQYRQPYGHTGQFSGSINLGQEGLPEGQKKGSFQEDCILKILISEGCQECKDGGIVSAPLRLTPIKQWLLNIR